MTQEGDKTMTEQAARAKNRFLLGVMFTIAAVTIAGSYVLFFAAKEGSLWGTTNQGQFVQPAPVAADLDLRDSATARSPFATEGVWWLWVVPQGNCDQPCEQALHMLRPLQALLNKDAGRVQRALLTTASTAERAAFAERYPRLKFFSGAGVAGLTRGVYLVDPIGNLVLRYDFHQAGEPVLKDLKRLLKVSRIG